MHPRQPAVTRGFTVVELLVTVSIIALLIGMLLPGLGMVRATARATKSQSNLRQWGVGTISWTSTHDDKLPWEGLKDANDMATNLAQPNYWANAIPLMVGQRAYADISNLAFQEQHIVATRGKGLEQSAEGSGMAVAPGGAEAETEDDELHAACLTRCSRSSASTCSPRRS